MRKENEVEKGCFKSEVAVIYVGLDVCGEGGFLIA